MLMESCHDGHWGNIREARGHMMAAMLRDTNGYY